MTNVVIEPRASLDIEEAAKWYESQLTGLGVEFVLEIDFAIEKAQENPKLYFRSYRSPFGVPCGKASKNGKTPAPQKVCRWTCPFRRDIAGCIGFPVRGDYVVFRKTPIQHGP